MKLTELEPSFLKIIDDETNRRLDNINEADGIVFSCPLCYKNNNNSLIGVHSILCYQPHVPQTQKPDDGRWRFEGNNYEDLSLVNGSSSVLLLGGCQAHFLIQNGQITFC